MERLEENPRRSQWLQLIVLTVCHGLADLFAGMLAPLLPAIRAHAGLSLTRGIALITAIGFTCNGVQILVGPLRSRSERPLLMPLGMLLAGMIGFLGFIPADSGRFLPLFFLCMTAGVGVAMVHPEGLRAIHRLDEISPSICTAVFMFGGFGGFVAGSWGCTHLVDRWGLRSLIVLPVIAIAAVLVLQTMKIRMAYEKHAGQNALADDKYRLSFWLVLIMAIPATIGTTIMLALLPTYLSELGYALPFGGRSVTMIGAGGALGSFFWANAAKRRGELGCIATSLIMGTPFLMLYLLLIHSAHAAWVLVPAGFFCVGAYPLTVTLAQHARGPALGVRMALVCGGATLVAQLVLLVLAPWAKAHGTGSVMPLSWIGFAVSAALCLALIYKEKRQQARTLGM